jgi:[ribosomal protein S5]-alanine N-acetyltransferase
VTLTTARLTLRFPEEADAEALRDYFVRNDERFAPWEPQRSPSIDEHRAWIAARRGGRPSAREPLAFLAFETGGAELAGAIELDSFTFERPWSASINYTLDGSYEGRGLATEALLAVIEYAFTGLGLELLSAYYHPANARSERLLLRTGFTIVARTEVVPGFERLMRPNVLAQRRATPPAARAR